MSQSWQEWFDTQRRALRLTVSPTTLARQTDWHIGQPWALQRHDGSFFNVRMVTVERADGVRYSKPRIEQGPSAVVLAHDTTHGWLLQAKAEDGADSAYEHVYLGATFQVSAESLTRRTFPLADRYDRLSIDWLTIEPRVYADAGRIAGACRLGLVRVEASKFTVPNGGPFRWFTRGELDAARVAGIPCSWHFWAILGMWETRQKAAVGRLGRH